jgi:hypothetical protein
MITLVTGLWNIKRDGLKEGWSRSFDHYLNKFSELLKVENNMIIFGEPELESFVWKHRKKENTQFVVRSQSWFVNNEFYPLIQEIRKKPDWLNQSSWLHDSTQAQLELYNPLVMSKVFLLHDAKLLDSFNSDYLFWIDAGLTNTVHQGYFTHDKVLEKLPNYIDKFTFVCFPYQANNEIHGFSYPKINDWASNDVKLVARGGFFGGPKHTISDINTIYYSLLKDTLSKGYMGTEESIFSIMVYKNSYSIDYFEIESNGLMGKFFEDLKNDTLQKKSQKPSIDISKRIVKNEKSIDTSKVGLYVITFNSPSQFETLIQSMLEYDSDFITKTKKFLLDNSTDLSTTPRYKELCEQYNFEHIKKDNIGICGGRQFVSDHFNDSDLDVMIWSEDDMFFQNKPNETCRNGFNRYTPNLYQKCLDILKKEKFDFLKLNFTEYYGDNSTCWPWYNVPQDFREKHWPNKPKLPVHGLDPDAPLSNYKNIKSHRGIPYATGEIYYCNWTHFITKEGNKKMFQDTKWQHPFENTYMSHIYQETIKGKINSGLLLLTPIEHNRFEHYSSELRREN